MFCFNFDTTVEKETETSQPAKALATYKAGIKHRVLLKSNCPGQDSGATLPLLGVGTWQLKRPQVAGVVDAALREGIRLIDTAAYYGNEAAIGRALKAAQQSVAREELFVTTKLWSDDMGADRASRAFDKSFAALGLEYIDLYLIHWPSDDPRTNAATWRALEKIQQSGRARAIGVSNFGVRDLQA